MNIPIIIEIAISLIFIYLILSLLASEIQELIATLLQWRAVHLKESIECLLVGNNKREYLKQIRQLTDQLYDNPLIKTLNQEAKGFLAQLPRRFNHLLGAICRLGRKSLFGQHKHSGPSYIPSEVFASSLLKTLKITDLYYKITALKLRWLVQDRLLNGIASLLNDPSDYINKITLKFDNSTELTAYLNIFAKKDTDTSKTVLILSNFYRFKTKLNKIITNFESNKVDLTITIDALAAELDRYIELSQTYLPKNQTAQLKLLNEEILGNPKNERLYLLRDLQLTILQVVEIIGACAGINYHWQRYKNDKQVRDRDAPIKAAKESIKRTKALIEEVKQDPDPFKPELMAAEVHDICNEIEQILNRSSTGYEYQAIINFILNLENSRLLKEKFLDRINTIIAIYEDGINDEYEQLYEQFKYDIENNDEIELTESAKELLMMLGSLANLQTIKPLEDIELIISQVLELKLPKILLINLIIIARRLQKDLPDIKDEYYQFEREVARWFDRSMERASGVYKRNAKLVAIVIGCIVAVAANADTLHMVERLTKDQALRSAITQTANEIASEDSELTPETLERINRVADYIFLPLGWSEFNQRSQRQNRQSPWDIRYLVGWLLSGIAISMGASFWYDVLGKVMDVSNVGKKPKPLTYSKDD